MATLDEYKAKRKEQYGNLEERLTVIQQAVTELLPKLEDVTEKIDEIEGGVAEIAEIVGGE